MLNTALIISTLLLVIFSFGLGIFSLYTNPKSRVVQLWFFMSMAIGIWSLALYFLMTSQGQELGILASKFIHLGAAFIPVFFLHFVLVFLFRPITGKAKLLLIVGYILAVVFGILSFTRFIVLGSVGQFGFSQWVSAGSLYPFFLMYFWFYFLVSVYFLYQGYINNGGARKKQIFYILLAALIGFIGGGTNFLPQTVEIYPYGHFLTWLYPALITYGIFIKD